MLRLAAAEISYQKLSHFVRKVIETNWQYSSQSSWDFTDLEQAEMKRKKYVIRMIATHFHHLRSIRFRNLCQPNPIIDNDCEFHLNMVATSIDNLSC